MFKTGDIYPLPAGGLLMASDFNLKTSYTKFDDQGSDIALMDVPEHLRGEYSPIGFGNTKELHFGWHYHNESESGILCKGSATIYFGKTISVEKEQKVLVTHAIEMNDNDVWHIPAGKLHYFDFKPSFFALINFYPTTTHGKWEAVFTHGGEDQKKSADYDKYIIMSKNIMSSE